MQVLSYLLPYALADIKIARAVVLSDLKSKSNEVRIKSVKVKEMKDDRLN